jgi:hypothetical protein
VTALGHGEQHEHRDDEQTGDREAHGEPEPRRGQGRGQQEGRRDITGHCPARQEHDDAERPQQHADRPQRHRPRQRSGDTESHPGNPGAQPAEHGTGPEGNGGQHRQPQQHAEQDVRDGRTDRTADPARRLAVHTDSERR